MSGNYLGFSQANGDWGPSSGGSPTALAPDALGINPLLSALSGEAERNAAVASLLDIIRTNNQNYNQGQAIMGRGIDTGDVGAGFGNSQPGQSNVTRGNMDLGPQAGVMKTGRDVTNTIGTLARTATGIFGGPVTAMNAIRSNPAFAGTLANVMNVSTLADKVGEFGARGGPAQGGEKAGFGSDRPGSLSQAEVAAQMANAIATNDMGGSKDDAATGGVGTDSSSGNSNSANAGGSTNSGPDSNGMAAGGIVQLANGGKIAVGPGGGLDDLIPTTINGERAAALSDGEFVVPADVVSMMGDGSTNAGARRLYDLVRNIRDHKTGSTQQAGPLPVGDILKRSMR